MVSVAILGGTGKLGSALIRQIHSQKENLTRNLNFGVCVNTIASSNKMFMASCLVDFDDIDGLLDSDDAQDLDMDALQASLEADVNPHRIVIDCTNDDKVADQYEKWMDAGVNVISPGRQAAAGPMERYQAIQRAHRVNSVEWQYESTVGSALPIVSTLRDLVQTGDEVQSIRGCLSGTMAYVFRNMGENDVSFSDAVKQAIGQDFTENDMREDLSGLDAARKIVILARELGMNVSMEDVEVESILPDEILNKEYGVEGDDLNAAILEDIKSLDDPLMKRYEEAAAEGKKLRYKFVIDVVNNKCKCSLEAVDNLDPLFRLRENENLVAFETSRYTTSPLIVKGAAAGPDLAASGMFADLLRLGRAFVGSQS